MRTERHRKESPTQTVTQQAGRLLKELNQRPSTTSIVVCLVVVLVVALGVGWYSYSRWETKNVSAEWSKLSSATKEEELQGIEKEYPSTIPALIARFDSARLQLRQGLEKYASADEKERGEARDKIGKAGELYAQLANEVGQFRSLSGTDSAGPLLRQEALQGAATAFESLDELDKALGYYKQLAGSKPESERVKEGAASVKRLEENKKQLEDFYTALRDVPAPKAPDSK